MEAGGLGERSCGCALEIARRRKGERGFAVLPRRWVVERTLAWLGKYRRMSKDFGGVDSSGDDLPHAQAAGDMKRIILAPKPVYERDGGDDERADANQPPREPRFLTG